jgi:hypothetical protein
LNNNRDIWEHYHKQYFEANKHSLLEDESYYDHKCYDVRFPVSDNKSADVHTYSLSELIK